MLDKTIFVQIASYRDPELIPTLVNMIDNADTPQNLKICVCWQHDEDEPIDLFLDNGFDAGEFNNDDSDHTVITLNYGLATIQLIDVPSIESKGACWARNYIQQFYDGETYTLQLDSHHRFVPKWDTLAIDMLESLKSEDCPKPLLTAYIPSYDPADDPKSRKNEVWQMGFDRFIPEGAVFFIPEVIPNWEKLEAPVPARFYSAHFCFTDGKFVEEVQHDPEYFFHGEEISIAVRAFTHGYDLFHPHKIIAWHEYTRKHRTKIWDDHTAGVKKQGKIDLDWHERNMMCHKRNRILFGMDGEDPNQIDFGKYGFGDARTVREYEEYAGISFKYRGVQQQTLDKKLPPNNFGYNTEDEWKNSMARSNDIRVLLNKSELGEFLDDYDFFYVGAHNAEGKELYRKDLTKQQIYNYYNHGEWIDYQMIFLTTEIPATYTIWPHSESRGWMNKIDRKV